MHPLIRLALILSLLAGATGPLGLGKRHASGLAAAVTSPASPRATVRPLGVPPWMASFVTPAAIAVDRHHIVYVLDAEGKMLTKLSPGGQVLRQWRVGDQYSVLSGVAVDDFGTVYVADKEQWHIERFTTSGGRLPPWGPQLGNPSAVAVHGSHVYVGIELPSPQVVELSLQGKRLKVWSAAAASLAVDSTGGVYVASPYYVTPSLPPRESEVPCPTPTPSLATTDHVGKLSGPFPEGLLGTHVAVDRHDDVYIANGSMIDKRSSTGKLLAQFGRKSTTNGLFRCVGPLAIGDRGRLYVVDCLWDRVDVVSPSGELLATWGTGGTAPGRFDDPTAITVGPHGWIYVADSGNNRVQVLSAEGHPLSQWPIPTIAGSFFTVALLTADRRGDLYAVGMLPSERIMVVELSPEGHVLQQWPTASAFPLAIAVDTKDNVYIGPTDQAAIERLSPSEVVIVPRVIRVGPDAIDPTGLAVDRSGAIYAVSDGPESIWKITPTGKILVTRRLAHWDVQLLDVDAEHRLYVTDLTNDSVDRVTFSGRSTTVFALETAHVQVGELTPIARDAQGRLFIADAKHNRVLEVSFSATT